MIGETLKDFHNSYLTQNVINSAYQSKFLKYSYDCFATLTAS